MRRGPDGAYLAGLKMLARRELAEAQVRSRLARLGFDDGDIDPAVIRLKGERALDDSRTARALARTEARTKHRGRARVVRQIEAIGIASSIAHEAAREVYADLDEHLLVEQAVERRLRGGASLDDPATARRIHRYLLTQGFDSHSVRDVMRRLVHGRRRSGED